MAKVRCSARDRSGLIALIIATSACAATSSPPRLVTPIVNVQPAKRTPAPSATAGCPAFSEEDLFVPDPTFDTSPVDLAQWVEVLPTTQSGSVVSLDLGDVGYVPTPPPRAIRVGFGWQALNPVWLEGLLGSEIDVELATWSRLGSSRMDHYVQALKLEERAEAEQRKDSPSQRLIRCLTDAAELERGRAKPIESAIEEATRELVKALEKRASRTSGETYLLASLSEDLIAYDAPDREAQLEPIRDAFFGLSEDPDAPMELRARAREQLARIADTTAQQIVHLQAVLTYTSDPALQADTHLKLAQLVADDLERKQHFLDAFALLEGVPDQQWKIVSRGLDLAAIEMRRSDIEAARDVVLRSVWASRPLDHDRPDPWRTSNMLAEIVVEAGSRAGDTMPRGLIGPFAAALLHRAKERVDRALGKAVAQHLLRVAPDVPEAVDALATLVALSEGKERLAYEAALRARVNGGEVPTDVWRPAPTTPAAIESAARLQLRSVVHACGDMLRRGTFVVQLSVRNHPSTIRITGADLPTTRCLELRIPSRFRGLPPVAISARLVPN